PLPQAGEGLVMGRASKDAVFGVDLAQQQAVLELLAGLVLAGNLLQRGLDDFRCDLPWHDDDAVDIAEDQVARGDRDTSAFDRQVAGHHLAATARVEWSDA